MTWFWPGPSVTITDCCRMQCSALQSDCHLCPCRANLPQSCQGQGEKEENSSGWTLTHISLLVKSPQCSVMPKLCLGKLLQFSAIVTSSKIRQFTAECHLLLPGKAQSKNYTGHIIITNRAFHLQICWSVVVIPSEGWGEKGERQGEERWAHGQEGFSRQNGGQGTDGAQLPQTLLLHFFLQAAHLAQQKRISRCGVSVKARAEKQQLVKHHILLISPHFSKNMEGDVVGEAHRST